MIRLITVMFVPLVLAACTTGPTGQTNSTTNPGSNWSYGCSPQAPAGYRVAQTSATGTLEVTVLSSSGTPAADQEVTATYTASTGFRCRSSVSLTTGADGKARFERMRTGPYSVAVESAEEASSTVQVKAGKTASVTLNLK